MTVTPWGNSFYEDMSPSQAAEALDGFFAEHGPVLKQLRSAMTIGGLDPDGVLDGTLESVAEVGV